MRTSQLPTGGLTQTKLSSGISSSRAHSITVRLAILNVEVWRSRGRSRAGVCVESRRRQNELKGSRETLNGVGAYIL